MDKLKLAAKQVASIFANHRLTYEDTRKVTALARKQLALASPYTAKKIPRIPPESELVKFYEYVEQQNNPRDIVLLRLLFYTGLRNAEITKLAVEDVDLANSRIYVSQGKGKKDRYVLFSESFKLVLQMYMRSILDNRWLFETTRRQPMSTRRLQQIVQEYVKGAGLDHRLYPHLFRHMLLTYLTSKGLVDSKIQLISGHASKESLAVYQHIGLGQVKEEYQQAMRESKI
jgi:integrase/recombinase XerD